MLNLNLAATAARHGCTPEQLQAAGARIEGGAVLVDPASPNALIQQVVAALKQHSPGSARPGQTDEVLRVSRATRPGFLTCLADGSTKTRHDEMVASYVRNNPGLPLDDFLACVKRVLVFQVRHDMAIAWTTQNAATLTAADVVAAAKASPFPGSRHTIIDGFARSEFERLGVDDLLTLRKGINPIGGRHTVEALIARKAGRQAS
jgi:hypothetical protein